MLLCDVTQFTCGGGECVEYGSRCDGVHDCPDGADEYLCQGNIVTNSSDIRRIKLVTKVTA